jgi:Mg2+ and Co2+ transporter CorA
MFKFRILPILSFLVLFVNSCGLQDKDAPLRERNEEVDEYFVTMEEVVDEYCNLVEKMVDNAQEIEANNAKGETSSLSEGLGFLKDMGSSVFKIATLSSKMERLQKQEPEFQKALNETDFEEFKEIYEHIIDRFIQMAEKLEKMDEKKEDTAA